MRQEVSRNGLLKPKNVNLFHDIYYDDSFLSLECRKGQELLSFEYREGEERFLVKGIKRKIERIGTATIDDGYFDLETPYGYGGYLSNTSSKRFIESAMNAYETHCREERIIAEFIRFHPFNPFPSAFPETLDFLHHDRDVVVVNLQQDLLSSYRSKVRNTIKKSMKSLTLKESTELDNFVEIYYQTMRRRDAQEFYFFDSEYFKQLMAFPGSRLFTVYLGEEPVSSAFFLFSDETVYYHLSANTEAGYRTQANYFLLHKVFEHARDEGYRYCILGGGTGGESDDPLFRFKKKFSETLYPFYIGGKVHNPEVYQGYIKLWREQSRTDIPFFLKYRQEPL